MNNLGCALRRNYGGIPDSVSVYGASSVTPHSDYRSCATDPETLYKREKKCRVLHPHVVFIAHANSFARSYQPVLTKGTAKGGAMKHYPCG
jgi:hypothetical protein